MPPTVLQRPGDRIQSGSTRHKRRQNGKATNIMDNWTIRNRGWTRRGLLLQASAAAMAAASGLYPLRGKAADIALEFDGSTFQLAAPEPNPKHGGVLRFGVLNRPPHFDFHQSGT